MSDNPDFISRQVLTGDYYFLDMAPDRETPFAVVCGGCETCGSGYVIDRGDFQYESIEYMASGRGTVTLDGEIFPLGPGSLFRYGPGIAHRIQVDPDSVLVKYFIDFSGLGLPQGAWRGPWATLRPLHVPERANIRGLFDDLQRTGRGKGNNVARRCSLLLEQIILLAEDEAVDSEVSRTASWLSYQRCREFIETRYLGLGSLGEIAGECNIGAAWLCRLFARYDDVSPYGYLMKLKIAHAASLLVDPDRLVKQVAQELGFDDPYHFSKVFKKFRGMSPERFRASGGKRF